MEFVAPRSKPYVAPGRKCGIGSLLRFTLVRAGKRCRLSARIPNHVSENRIHAPLNAGNFTSESGMVLTEFVEKIYLSYIEELRESTKKGCREIWNNHIRDRVGHICMHEFRRRQARC